MNQNGFNKRVVTRLLGAGLLAIAVVGCGSEKTSKISGKVLFQGRALPGGLVTFYPTEGQGKPASAVIEEDGSYSLSNAPVGSVKITVSNLTLKKAETAPGAKTASASSFTLASKEAVAKAKKGQDIPEFKGSALVGTYVPIPPSYGDVKTTSLDYSVANKSQEYDILLR